jgi:cystathionine beta-lyase/cystathionine gamma-synthase
VGGIVAARTPELVQQVWTWRKETGAIMGPVDAFLVLRGLRTLGMRMARHDENARVVATFLASHPKITSVSWPGLESSPFHALAVSQMSGFGSTFSFTVAGGFEAAKKFIESCKLAVLAVSLGCLETLVEHPASMTHFMLTPEAMKEQGICPELIRISVGVEDAVDIVADLRQALDKA